MSARNRGRANPNQDADEERRLWKEIKDKAFEVDVMVVGGRSFIQEPVICLVPFPISNACNYQSTDRSN